ncbi:hypothetical protein AGMMS50230_06720 [Spirochaetia bacterium]|nr:hypothetical protein AGMMS50230_06720 [Spirochaetia bacterium]
MASLKKSFGGRCSGRTAWSYRAGNSFLHRLQADVKLLFLVIITASPFLGPAASVSAAALILAGALSVRLRPHELFAGSRPLAILLVIVTLFRGINFAPLGRLIDSGLITIMLLNPKELIDPAGLLSALRFAGGILISFAAGSLFFAVTTMTEIRGALEKIELFLLRPFSRRKTARLSLALALMLGFLPRFFELWESANLAARSRGSPGFRRTMVILPLVTERMIETALETASALEARGLEL